MAIQLRDAFFACAISLVAMSAAALTVDPAWNRGSVAASGRSVVTYSTEDTPEMIAETFRVAPTNVLEDVPRELTAEPRPAACKNDAPISEVPAACRRLMAIAGSL